MPLNRFPKEPFGLYNGGTLGANAVTALGLNKTNFIQMRPFNAALFFFNFGVFNTCNGITFMVQGSTDGSTPVFQTDQLLQPAPTAAQNNTFGPVFANNCGPCIYNLDMTPFRQQGFTSGSSVSVLVSRVVMPYIRLFKVAFSGASTDVVTISAELKQLKAG